VKWSGVQLGEGYECQNYKDEQLLVLPAYVDPDDRGRYVWVSDVTSPDYGLWMGDGVAGAWVKAAGGIRTLARPWGNGVPGELRRDAVTGVIFIWNDTYAYWQAILCTETAIDYHIDPVAGDDTDTGADPAHALATIMEAIWRLPPLISDTVTIYLTGGVAGAPLTYDEALEISNLRFQGAGELLVVGASALASLPTGPNQATTTAGTFNAITVMGAGWTPGAMVGLRVYWTSGAQAAAAPYAFIVDNTADTLFLSATSVLGAYGVGDTFDIEEITTILQNVSAPPCTLELYNLFGAVLSWGMNAWVTFQDVHVVGDGMVNLAVNLGGTVAVEFLASRIDDIVAGAGTGSMVLDQCGIFLTANGVTTPWFSSAPDWSGSINALFTGGILTLLQESSAYRFAMFLWGAVYGDGVITEMFIQRSGHLYLSLCRLFGNVGTATPILCDRGGGRVYIQDCEADQALDAIIHVPHWGMSNVQIEVDPNAGGSDLRESPFAIDMSAPGTVIFRHATFSTISHFTAGMRLRNGGMAVFFGALGNEPTLVGPAPGDEIEFDDNVGGPYILFIGPSATGLQTLCRYMYDGTGPL